MKNGCVVCLLLLVLTHTAVWGEAPKLDIAPMNVEIAYALPKPARASMAVYDRDGRLVRVLLTGQPHSAGKHVMHWDGLDRYGNPLSPGEYSWKLLATTGLRAEFITQVGQNTNPAWERATGNHEAPVGACIDSTGLYRVGATNEGSHYAVKTDLDGKHLWAIDRYSADPWSQGTVAVTLLNDRLFELLPNGDLYGYDTKTGRVFTGGNHDPKPWNFGWEGYAPPPDTTDDEKRRLRAKQCPSDLAVDPKNGMILAAFPQYDAVCWYSADNGKHSGTKTGLTKLAGIACGNDGTVFALCNGEVVAFHCDGNAPKVVIAAEWLKNPWRLTVDPKSGDILIAENSLKFPGAKPHHQVKRFALSGKLLKTYGAESGRGDGDYIPTDFRGMTDIEADGNGGVIVTEGNHTPPRRIARFDANGKLLREWYGAQHYGVLACPEPNNPRFVWTLANAPHQGLVRWEVDYAAKTWRVAEVYQDVFAANPYANVPQVPDLFEKNGRIYIQGGALHGGLSLAIYDPSTKTIRPCVASAWRDNKKKSYLWCDQNDDGKATDDEIAWNVGHQIGGWIEPTTFALLTTPAPTDYQPGARFDPLRVTRGGTPVYDTKPTSTLTPVVEAGGSYHPSDFRRDADGNLFGCFADSVKNPHEGAENHGAWYYNSCSAIDRLVKWNKDGKLLWSVGRHSPDNDHLTGSTAMPRGLVGLTHDCVIWGDASDEETARPTVWTQDGLYVDELLRVPSDDIPKSAYGMFNANEYACGRLYTDPVTGEVLYFAINSGGGSPIYRISGWDGWHRTDGKVTLSDKARTVAKRDGLGLTGEYFNNPDCAGLPAVTRIDQLIYFHWGNSSPDNAITADEFSVRWTGQYEAATNEGIRFEVRGSFPWRDRGKPTFTRLWLNGQLLIDSTTDTNTVRVKLVAGQRVDLRLECGFKKGQAAVAFSHDTPGLDRRAVMPEFLHPQATGEKSAMLVTSEPRPSILAHFDFEEQDGPLTWNTTGGDIFGRLTGDAELVRGKIGNGVELSARGEFAPAVLSIDEELRLPDFDYAVTFWFQTTSENTLLCEAKRYSSYNNRWSDHVLAVESGRLHFRLKGDQPLVTAEKVNDGMWHYVVSTVEDSGQKLYLDGRLVGTGKLSRRTTSSNRLGLDLGPGGGHGTVALDEVRIFGVVPSAEEIREQAER